MPDYLSFNLLNNFTLNNHITLIFPDRATYEFFIERLQTDGREEQYLIENTEDEVVYKLEYLSEVRVGRLDELEDNLGDNIYNNDFLKKLEQARISDEKYIDIAFEDIVPNSTNYLESNYHIVILDEL
ncbi:hypothetical protein [Desulfosporosinus sp. Sb-LF]|uniref:hypothetical protein n=1 Tax=Desulfosporosinus sp. Sb-LF TaxID=2560027 RepID=UPI00107F6005|nr:hypothetical protein [Desulfosporosinus sp. Sb-LF]TGE34338.1 hypothetical protein E4K68_01155 [Desulfosporosinus sp. Sb-LF]